MTAATVTRHFGGRETRAHKYSVPQNRFSKRCATSQPLNYIFDLLDLGIKMQLPFVTAAGESRGGEIICHGFAIDPVSPLSSLHISASCLLF